MEGSDERIQPRGFVPTLQGFGVEHQFGLSNQSLSNALLHLLRDDHPTLAERIEFANTYKPWEKGEPLVYGELFRK